MKIFFILRFQIISGPANLERRCGTTLPIFKVYVCSQIHFRTSLKTKYHIKIKCHKKQYFTKTSKTSATSGAIASQAPNGPQQRIPRPIYGQTMSHSQRAELPFHTRPSEPLPTRGPPCPANPRRKGSLQQSENPVPRTWSSWTTARTAPDELPRRTAHRRPRPCREPESWAPGEITGSTAHHFPYTWRPTLSPRNNAVESNVQAYPHTLSSARLYCTVFASSPSSSGPPRAVT
jgi:hypothetical protein